MKLKLSECLKDAPNKKQLNDGLTADDYRNARPNSTKLMDIMDVEPNSLAGQLIQYFSDDDIGDFMKEYGYGEDDEDEEDDDFNDYDRRAVEKDYNLEDGELDGVDIRDAEEMVGEEEGALDRYIFAFQDGLDESKKPVVENTNYNRDQFIFKVGETTYTFKAHTDDTPKGFNQVVELLLNGKETGITYTAKYVNRTWEQYDYEKAMLSLVDERKAYFGEDGPKLKELISKGQFVHHESLKEELSKDEIINKLKSMFDEPLKRPDPKASYNGFCFFMSNGLHGWLYGLGFEGGFGYNGYLKNDNILATVSFAEGDYALHIFDNEQDYQKSVEELKDFYSKN